MFRADGCDAMRQCFELGKQYGQHKRNDELLAWTKAQRRLLAREDLIGVVCGIAPPMQRNPPPALPQHRKYARSHHHSHRHGSAAADRSPRHLPAHHRAAPQEPLRPAELEEIFSDALAINGTTWPVSSAWIIIYVIHNYHTEAAFSLTSYAHGILSISS
jgi:hypothetical protein